ncbi:predicted protein [Plenodomus lingam JN3]|uniref:Predicted protein n=1 Tax=Leptosphaeria maculans (strain JN3 / isolate v23.1.3 / race Av1-4-5-6-7-8) TaxID=985895 RepID=E4ZXP1_LEPMJ|nr:predicted protein [Plenodomus lingam JN3]CBX96136.1 predicted protein [Plenodomus lingam JN3]
MTIVFVSHPTSHLSTHAPRGICTKILSCLVLHEVQSTRIFHYYLPPIYQHYHSGGTLRRPISTSKVAQTIPTELRLACHNLYQELGSRHTDSVVEPFTANSPTKLLEQAHHSLYPPHPKPSTPRFPPQSCSATSSSSSSSSFSSFSSLQSHTSSTTSKRAWPSVAQPLLSQT